MAKRPVFVTTNERPFFQEENIEFQYYNGFAEVQKKKSIKSLHETFLLAHPESKILEISSKSESKLGIQLSAFNLMINTKTEKSYSVEVAFQASKVFEYGGPYKDLLTKTSREAKKDPRLKNSGKLKAFNFGNRSFELFPTTLFYNWLYINTLHLYPELEEQLMDFNAFTDIAFNPDKSINCQARAAAVYVSLRNNDLHEKALESKEQFLEVVYGKNTNQVGDLQEQLSLWNRM